MLHYIRFTVFFIFMTLISLCFVLIGLLCPFHPSMNKVAGSVISRGALKILGIRLIYQGISIKEVEKNFPFIICSNHQHNFDIFLISNKFTKRTITLGKFSILFIPIFGLMYYLSGNILIKRNSKKNSYLAINKAVEAIKKNKSVFIFPEGTRNTKTEILPFKKGIYHAAKRANCPIMPIAISHYADTIDLNKYISATIIVKYLPPFFIKANEDATQALERLRQIIITNQKEINNNLKLKNC